MRKESSEKINPGIGTKHYDDLYSLAVNCSGKSLKKFTKNNVLSIWLIISFLYTILKMYRNSMDGTAGSAGGIWNIMNISYVLLAALLVMSCIKKSISLPMVISDGFIYSFFVAFVSLLNPRALSINTVFNYAMLFYFASVAFTFYYASSKGITKSEYKYYNILYFALAAFTLYLMYSRIAYNKTNIYQSDAYFLLCALPLVMLFDKSTHMYIKIIPLVVCLMMAGKRTGFLGLAGAVFIYYLIDCIQKKNMDAFLKIALKLGVVVALFFVVYSFLETRLNLTLLDRMETITTDGGSGRDEIYAGVWQAIKASDFFELFFGRGMNGIQVVFGRKTGAHNDFLEIMYNFGIFAVVFLVHLYVKMIVACVKMTKSGYPGAKAAGAAVVISVLMSLFSNYFVTFTHITMTATFWGIVIADWKHYQHNKAISGGYHKHESNTISK